MVILLKIKRRDVFQRDSIPILVSCTVKTGKFKLLLTFKALYGMAPSYIIDLINVKTNTRYSLRSSEGILLKHPSGRMKKSFGDRSFSVAAPTLWNALPASLRNIKCKCKFKCIKCISTFKSNLKTYLFKLAFSIS